MPSVSHVTRRATSNAAAGFGVEQASGRHRRRSRHRSSGARCRVRRRAAATGRRRVRARRRRATTSAPRSPRTPDDDERERPIVGEVEPLDTQHVGTGARSERGRGRSRRADEPEHEDLRPGVAPAASTAASIVVTRPSGWRTGSNATNQPAPWRLVTSPSCAEHIERAPHGDPARAVLGGELGLAREGAARPDPALGDPGPERVGEVEVAHDLYRTCLDHERQAWTASTVGFAPQWRPAAPAWRSAQLLEIQRGATLGSAIVVTPRQLPVGEVGEGHLLQHTAQARPHRDPQLGQVLRRARRSRGPGAGRPAPPRAGPRPRGAPSATVICLAGRASW